MIKSATRIHAPWLAEAREKGREAYKGHGRTSQLIRAAIDGNEQRVRELVAAGAPLDHVDQSGWSALHRASYRGHAHIAKLLLDGKYEGKGADIDAQCKDVWTPLISASCWGHEAVVRLLLERDADIELRDKIGRTALSTARLYNHASIVALLNHASIMARLVARGAPE
jgi:ankyrin repeat protein